MGSWYSEVTEMTRANQSSQQEVFGVSWWHPNLSMSWLWFGTSFWGVHNSGNSQIILMSWPSYCQPNIGDSGHSLQNGAFCLSIHTPLRERMGRCFRKWQVGSIASCLDLCYGGRSLPWELWLPQSGITQLSLQGRTCCPASKSAVGWQLPVLSTFRIFFQEPLAND